MEQKRWEYRPSSLNIGTLAGDIMEGSERVASVMIRPGYMADVRAMLASRELLAALTELVTFEEDVDPECGSAFCVALRAAHAAIALAEGRTP